MGSVPSSPLLMDEDANLVPDLGNTWSTPNLGRVRLCQLGGSQCAASPVDPQDDDDVIEAYVAIFGGGLDPDVADKSQPERGDWIYMLDVETGKVLYKRQLCSPYVTTSCVTAGGMASEPAAVDTDLDGFLDRLYIQTTGGFLFRIDLGPTSGGVYPSLGPELATARDPATGSLVDVVVVRVPRENFDTGERFWEPRAIFDANWDTDGTTGAVTPSASRRPFYHRPSVFFAALLDRFGLALGTGDREDLWAKTFQEARFYVFIDDTDELDPSSLPLNEGDLRRVLVEDPDISADLFLTRGAGQKGWFLELDEEERVITDSFALSGLTIFSSFKPAIAVTDDPCDPLTDPNCSELETASCGDKTFEADTDNLCARTGISRNFVVGTTNAKAFLFTVDGQPTRYKAVSAFVTSPYTEPGQNKNSDSGSSEPSADALTALEVDVMDNLKQLFPENCKFANYRVDIKTIAADTRVERIAPIPVCVVEKNWKEY
jgi:hypothetical protein